MHTSSIPEHVACRQDRHTHAFLNGVDDTQDLGAWLQSISLDKYEGAIRDLGASEVSDLKDMGEEEFQLLDMMRPLEKKKLRRKIAEL